MTWSSKRRAPSVVAAAIAMALVVGPAAALAAGATTTKLEKELAAAQKRPTKIGITTPLRTRPPAGKKVAWLQCGVPACARLAAPLKQAATTVGWRFQTIDEGLTPEKVKAAWDQVVREKPDAVVVSGGFPTAIFKDELAQVKARGIPIVGFGDATVKPPPGYVGVVDGALRFRDLLGKTFADWIAAKSKGKANVLWVYTSTFPVHLQEVAGYKAEIAKVCPGCKNVYYDAPATSIGKDLASKVASQVQAHPEVTYIVGALSDAVLGLPDALKGVGVDAKKVKLITQDQDATVLKAVQDGAIEMTIAHPGGEIQWQTMDVLLRKVLGQPVGPSQSLRTYTRWILTKGNLPPKSQWNSLNSVVSYKAQFKKLWKVG
jgi:ribose transport system substrate-binding protein